MHSSSLWLSFLAIVQQGRALERRFRSAQRHEYVLPHLPEIYRKPPKSGHLFTPDTLDGTNGVCIIEVPLYYVSNWIVESHVETKDYFLA